MTTALNTANTKTAVDGAPESFMERWLILPKVLYFLLNMYIYALHSVIAFFFADRWKFPYYKFSYASSFIIANFFGAMLWSSLADKTGRYKSIIVFSIIFNTVVAVALLFPLFETVDYLRYVYPFSLMILYNFSLSAAFPLLDAQILGMLAANPKLSKEQFNNQRMFGAIGHLVATLFTMTKYSATNIYPVLAYQICASVLFSTVVMFGVPNVKPVKGGHHGHHGGHKTTEKNGEPIVAPANPVKACLSNGNFMFFMLFIAASGVVRAITTNFQKPLAKAFADGRVGLASTPDIVRTISEVFVYMTAKYMKQWMGIYWILMFSQLTGLARLWGYTLVTPGTSNAFLLVFFFEALKGFNSGLISSSAIPIASSLAPPGCESTVQGLYSGNYSGLSMALGGVIGGVILQSLAVNDNNTIQDIQRMASMVTLGGFIITLVLMAKYIFVDRVMGIPGFPRRHSFHK